MLAAALPLLTKKFGVKFNKRSIDTWVFPLHYNWTVVILLVFTLIIAGSEYYGGYNIACHDNKKFGGNNFLDIFCWTRGTFSVISSFDKFKYNEKNGIPEDPYPGIAKHTAKNERVAEDDKKIVFHKYYQWVPLVLFAQACSFYLTRFLWKNWEGKRVARVVAGLDTILPPKDQTQREDLVANYLLETQRINNSYAIWYYICEFFNLIHVIVQFCLTASLLGPQFWYYGTRVISYELYPDSWVGISPMVRLFPKLTKCTLRSYGPSGSIETKDTFCFLPLNVMYEKFYLFLWFWYIFLATASVLSCIYWGLYLFSKHFRYYLIRAKSPFLDNHKVKTLVSGCSFGDVFFIYLLSKNMNPVAFRNVIKKFVVRINSKYLN